MTAAAKKKATSTKAKKTTTKKSDPISLLAPSMGVRGAAKAALKVVDPAGNSGIPAPAPKGFNGRKVKLLTKVIENRRLPNQAGVILDTLEALGGEASQEQLVDAMLEQGLSTVQTPKRIYTFYRKMLMEDGFITYA
jgi:hypothetical protein|tara:strand:+ start:390 stop:800 length:411 start_codon:yes stop_codon:yes gene_type:complete